MARNTESSRAARLRSSRNPGRISGTAPRLNILRNNALDAPNFFDVASAPPFQRNQFGGSIGGPIQKDKTFVFANYEGFRQNLHQTSRDLVPDAQARNGTPTAGGCPAAESVAAPRRAGAPDFVACRTARTMSRKCEFPQSRCKRSARISEPRAWITYFQAGFGDGGVHHR